MRSHTFRTLNQKWNFIPISTIMVTLYPEKRSKIGVRCSLYCITRLEPAWPTNMDYRTGFLYVKIEDFTPCLVYVLRTLR